MYKNLLSKVKTFEGRASLLDKNTVQVENVSTGEKESVTSKYILVATGAGAVFIDIPGKVGSFHLQHLTDVSFSSSQTQHFSHSA